MEVTHLDRDITEYLPYSRSSIKDNRLNSVPLVLQHSSSLSIHIDGFVLHFLNIQVLFQMRCPYDTDAEAFTEECHIGDDNYGVREMIVLPYRKVVYAISYPVFALLVFL